MSSSATNPDIPEKSWDNPFMPGTPLHSHFEKILEQNRDLIIILDDFKGRRGTGKTVASMKLADGMDQTEEGLTFEKCSLRPEEIRNAYVSQPPGSGLVLDEAEVGASNRDAMSSTNKALREIMSMGRVEEKYVVVNAPVKEFIDKDIQKLADVWISMQRKGHAIVHFLEWHPYAKKLLHPKKQEIEFTDIPKGTDLRDVYNKLTREKRKQIMGEDGSSYVTESECREREQQAKKQARREERDSIIENISRHPEFEVRQQDIGDVVGLDGSQVSRILNDE